MATEGTPRSSRRLRALDSHIATAAAGAAAAAIGGLESRSHVIPHTDLLIDNSWVKAEEMMAVNAWDGTCITHVAVAGEAEIDAAVSCARKAFATWRVSAPLDRTKLLNRFADLVEEHAEELAQLECLELGKPIEEARGGVGASLMTYRYYAGWPDKIMGDLPPPGTPGFHTEVRTVSAALRLCLFMWQPRHAVHPAWGSLRLPRRAPRNPHCVATL